MKKIKVEIEIYSYDELSGDAKNKAFDEHKEFLDSLEEEYENEEGELIKEFIDHDKESVEDSLKINEYWFFNDGSLLDCVTYTGKHEKSGTTELKFQNKIYLI